MNKTYVIVDERVNTAGVKFERAFVYSIKSLREYFSDVKGNNINSIIKGLNKRFCDQYQGCFRAYRLLRLIETDISQKDLKLIEGEIFDIQDTNVNELLKSEIQKRK